MKYIERLEGRYEARGARVIERFEGHYEAQEVLFGEVYGWCPEYVVIECGCREKLTLTHSMAENERGADLATTAQEDRYSWVEDCFERLEGKEARQEYCARLEQAAPR